MKKMTFDGSLILTLAKRPWGELTKSMPIARIGQQQKTNPFGDEISQ